MFGPMRDKDAARITRLDQAAGGGTAPEARFSQCLHMGVAIRHYINAMCEKSPMLFYTKPNAAP